MARRSSWLGALALALVPFVGNSLGLGDIKLNSYLNERLNAEIVLSLSAADELGTLRVGIASHAEFDRVGIDRPRFLNDIEFVVARTSASSALIRVSSPEPIVEPFVTFLIEAQWSGGRLIREYTVLLDPPTFLPTPEAPAVAAPQPATESPTTGVVRRAAPAPDVRPAQSVPSSGAMPSHYGPVRRNETLWSIAQSLRPDESVSVNQVMLALFRANPDAFDGNINRMLAGTTLRVPAREDITGVPRGEATAEVRRQNTRWRGAPSGPAAGIVARDQVAGRPTPTDEPRLELVPPTEVESPAADGAAPSAGYVAEQEALNEELLNAVQSLRGELEETRQAIGIKDAEIAALQGRLAQLEADRGALPQGPAAGADAMTPTGDTSGALAPTDGTPSSQAPGATAGQTATVIEPEVAVPPPVSRPPTASVSRPATEGGGLFSSLWIWIAAAVVVLSGLFFVWKRRQEAETETYEAWAPTPSAAPGGAAADESAIVVEEAPRHADTEPATPEIEEAAAQAVAQPAESTAFDDTGILESLAPEAPIADEADQDILQQAPVPDDEATGTDYQYPFEDTIAGATGINLEQSDPLAEADFHMAYGLYDQAADLIRKAIDREPDRHDLRLKMLDILFVWGKKDEFVTEVRAFKDSTEMDPSDWSRVAIMGRQIAPEDPLFEGDGATMTLDHAVIGEEQPSDLAAVGGALDFDLAGGPETVGTATETDVLDFDIGSTGELPGFGAASTAEGQEVAPDQTAELEIEDLGLGLDLDLGSLAAEKESTADATLSSAETIAQTMEAPPPGASESMAETIEAPRPQPADAMAETMEVPAAGGDDQTGITEMIERAEEILLDEEAADTGVLMDDVSDTGILRDESSDTEVLTKVGPSDGETGITEMLEELDESDEDMSGVFAADDLQTEFESVEEQTSTLQSLAQEDTGELQAALDEDTGELTGIVDGATDEMLALAATEGTGDTSQTKGDTARIGTDAAEIGSDTAQIEAVSDQDPGLDLDDLTQALGVDLEPTVEMQTGGDAPDGDTLIAEVFGSDAETRVAPARDVLLDRDDDATREMPRIDTSEVTLSEVGTKLDLARAYIDMGDPDGARSILEEVIDEGDDSQKSEAQDLLQGIG